MKLWKKALLALSFGTMIWSGVFPKDYFTWFLEVLPVMIGLPVLLYFESKKKVSSLMFFIVTVHCVVLSIGGHYTYAEVPLGYWLQDIFGFSRNHYDRIGHFMQGVTPALLCLEIFTRKRVMARSFWLGLCSVAIALSFSAFYELIEWWAAVLTGEAADAFLGTQGDIWDTQWDMFLALCGALTTNLILFKTSFLEKLSNS